MTHKSLMSALLLAAAALTACGGDSRAVFVGSYQTTRNYTVTINGQAQSGTDSTLVSVEESQNVGELVFTETGSTCTYQATLSASDSNAFVVNSGSCTGTNSGCQVTLTITGGSGSRIDAALNWNLNANTSITCPDGSAYSGTYQAQMSATRQ
jgi:hypothetical protein